MAKPADVTVARKEGIDTVKSGGATSFKKTGGDSEEKSTTDFQDVTGLAAAARRFKKPTPTPRPTAPPIAAKKVSSK